MPKNVDSSSGIGEDIIRAIQQMCCSELHLITLYQKTIAELENGLIDLDDEEIRMAHFEKAERYREDVVAVTQLRREMMVKLFEMFDGDKDVWCMVKHLGSASYCAWECYLASDDDPSLLSIAVESNKLFTKYLSAFLGMEISSCSSCLSDFLRGKEEAK